MIKSLVVAVVVATVTAVAPQVAAAAPALAFGPCPAEADAAGAECAVLRVPRDYAARTGDTIEITVSRVKARGERRGTIFGNPGGPGGDSLGFWSKRLAVLPAALLSGYDLVAVQPRGLRLSTPLQCGTQNADAPGAQRGSMKAACDKAQPGYLPTITTENTARDTDAVRAALGLERIGFMGVSYGTYLGAVYATLFPQRVDRLVLDSNVNPNWIWTEMFAQQQVAGRERFADLLAWIAAHDDVYGLGDTPLKVFRQWADQVVAQGGGWLANLMPPPAEVRDLSAYVGDQVAAFVRDGFNGSREQITQVQNLVRNLVLGMNASMTPLMRATAVAAYTRKAWPLLAKGLAETKANPDDVATLRQIATLVGTDPTSGAVFAAITCNENATPARPELIPAAFATIASGGDALDARAQMVRSGISCMGWEPSATPVQVANKGLAATPLVLQSYHDAATKYEGGPAMATAMGGKLIRVEGGDHGVFGRGNAEVDDAVLTYLATGQITIDHAGEGPAPQPVR